MLHFVKMYADILISVRDLLLGRWAIYFSVILLLLEGMFCCISHIGTWPTMTPHGKCSRPFLSLTKMRHLFPSVKKLHFHPLLFIKVEMQATIAGVA